jgi:hypothetical protein
VTTVSILTTGAGDRWDIHSMAAVASVEPSVAMSTRIVGFDVHAACQADLRAKCASTRKFSEEARRVTCPRAASVGRAALAPVSRPALPSMPRRSGTRRQGTQVAVARNASR